MEKGGAENPRNCFRPEKSHRLPPIDHTRCATAVTPSTVTVPSDFGERCLGKPADSSFSAPVAAVGSMCARYGGGISNRGVVSKGEMLEEKVDLIATKRTRQNRFTCLLTIMSLFSHRLTLHCTPTFHTYRNH